MREPIAKLIDHAVLQPTQTDEDVRAACELCAEVRVASICVKPSFVPLAVRCLEDSSVRVSTVIGFPHGGTSTEAKVVEAERACRQGATEVDMVVNLGKVLSGDWVFVERDIVDVVRAARERSAITKVILETGLLPNDELKVHLCRICEEAGAAYVKTSTGFGYRRTADGALQATGATEHDIRLMRASCGPDVGIKASGGIRSLKDARRFVSFGATRLGTSATREIVHGGRGAAGGGSY